MCTDGTWNSDEEPKNHAELWALITSQSKQVESEISREECYECINGSCIIHFDKPNNSKHYCIVVEQPEHPAVQNQPDKTNNPEEPDSHLNDDDLDSEANKENVPAVN